MTRRIIIIIVSALAILALMFFLWFWFFSGRGSEENTVGSLGTGQEATNRGGTGGTSGTNNETPIDTTPGTNESMATEPTPSYGTEISGDISDFGSGNISYSGDYLYVPGAIWMDGSYHVPTPGSIPDSGPVPSQPTVRDGVGGSGTLFNPTDINDVRDATIRGKAYFNFPEKDVSESELDAAFGIGGLALGCAADFLAQKVLTAPTTILKKGVNTILNFFTGGTLGAQEVYDPTNDQNQQTTNIINCVVRGLARAAIQTITSQTVNWINSGFEGKPAFVQNFNEFFSNVADQAAGEFIQGSALSFLCSPFQLEVRVAIAMSYAQRNVANAQTCTLSNVVDNVEGFVKGNFSDGGWPGLISFTTEPSNNPFGAYMTAQARLNNQILFDTTEASRKISPGGFLSKEECDPPGSQTNCKIVTPGSTIESALESTFKANLDSLQLADSINSIISALANQLITKTLYEGLSNVSGEIEGTGTQGRTPEERAATRAASELLSELKTALRYSEQYGAVQQGSIRDIQAVQKALSDLQNCWNLKGNVAAAAQAASRITTLEKQVTNYNDRITKANTAIARVLELQTDALAATNKNDIDRALTRLKNRQANGAIYTKEDVTSAQQNRETLQREMDAEERTANADLAQCNATPI